MMVRASFVHLSFMVKIILVIVILKLISYVDGVDFSYCAINQVWKHRKCVLIMYSQVYKKSRYRSVY